MTDRPKPKPVSHKTLNETRKNGKAPKAFAPHTKGVRLTRIQKVLIGGGPFRSWIPIGEDPRTQNEGKVRSRDHADHR